MWSLLRYLRKHSCSVSKGIEIPSGSWSLEPTNIEIRIVQGRERSRLLACAMSASKWANETVRFKISCPNIWIRQLPTQRSEKDLNYSVCLLDWIRFATGCLSLSYHHAIGFMFLISKCGFRQIILQPVVCLRIYLSHSSWNWIFSWAWAQQPPDQHTRAVGFWSNGYKQKAALKIIIIVNVESKFNDPCVLVRRLLSSSSGEESNSILPNVLYRHRYVNTIKYTTSNR